MAEDLEKGAQHDTKETEMPEYEKTEEKKPFVPSEGLTTERAEELLRIHGRNELQEKTTPKWLVFLQQLWGPMPILIWLAIIVEAAIQNWADMGILLGIQFANATIGWYETTKAGDAVAALKASLKPLATVKRDGKWQTLDAGIVVPGDLVLLASGSAVPADCIVNHGRLEIDNSALTGESLPVTTHGGDKAMMGATVVRGETEATIEFTGSETFFGKTATMLQSVNELGNLQKILIRIMSVLVVISLTLCGIALIYLLATGEKFKHSLQFVVVLLVASIPIAIEIVTTCTLAVGSRQLAAMDAIVTRLVSIEEMAGMNMLCSDKTGTLTLNKMVIQEECPTYVVGENRDSVVQAAALAAKWKEPPRDALDTMVLGTANLEACDVYEQIDFMPFDPTVKRTEGTLRGPDGKVFKTSKGAPHIILNLCHNKDEIEADLEEKVTSYGLRGIRCLAVAKTNEQDQWEMMGVLTFLDPPRPDTKRTIERAIEYGVGVKMITGDQLVIACETARTLGMGTNIKGVKGLPSMGKNGEVPKDLVPKHGKYIIEADGFAQVYPEHKYLIVETLRQAGYSVGMTGDGVNDAPALKRADVGIAVSGATDAARAAADIVITSPGLSVVVEAIIIARCIFQRVKSFINYRVAATLQLLCFFFISVFAFPPDHYQPAGQTWPTFFQLPVIMLMLITLLNDGTLISIGYDYVIPSQRPEKWNLKVLFIVSCVLAVVSFGSSLLLLWGCLDSYNSSGWFQKWNLPSMEYGQIVTAIYLKVSVSDFLTLFSARTQGPFYSQRPGKLLFFGCIGSLALSTVLAVCWPSAHIDDIPVLGLGRGRYHVWAVWVWLYCLFFWLIQDALKVLTYKLVYKYNVFNARDSRTQVAVPVSDVVEGGKEEEQVVVSYSTKTGAVLAKELKKEIAGQIPTTNKYSTTTGEKVATTSQQRDHRYGDEVEGAFEKGPDGEIYLSLSYSKERGSKLASELKDELAKQGNGQ